MDTPKKKFLCFVKWNFFVIKSYFKLFSFKKLNKNSLPLKSSYISRNEKHLIKFFYTLNKTLLGETGCLSNLYYLLAVQASSFLIHFLWLTWHRVAPEVSTLISLFLSLIRHHPRPEVTTLISYKLCYLQDTLPCQKSPLSLPTKLVPREAKEFPRGDKYPKDVPLHTFLAYLQPV